MGQRIRPQDQWCGMDVRTLCLGVLSQGDYTGYDIKKFFESSFASFFPAGYGSIYPALAQLLEKKLVSCESQAQDKLPDKKIYQITAAGIEKFQHALASGKGSHRLRSEFLVQMFFAENLERQQLGAIINQRLSDMENELNAMNDMIGNQQGSNESGGAAFTRGFNRAMLEAGRDYIRSHRVLVERSADQKVTHLATSTNRIAG